MDTRVSGISNDGTVAGNYFDNSSYVINNGNLVRTIAPHGFTESNGQYTTISVPNSVFTSVGGISNDGTVFGGYINSNGNTQGFIEKNGQYTTISGPSMDFNVTGISSNGTVVGHSASQSFAESNGQYTLISPPNSNPDGTLVSGITSNGVIYGVYLYGINNYLASFTATPAVVPVSAAVWLFGSALAGFGLFGRRKIA